MQKTDKSLRFGYQDNSYISAGGIEGLTQLVDDFYRHMEANSFSRRIFEMHPKDISVSREKLAFFLSGWLGGPRLYMEKYGDISIPGVHLHLDIGEDEKCAWLKCMEMAIVDQGYTPEFSIYLLEQLSVPANRVELVCQKNKVS